MILAALLAAAPPNGPACLIVDRRPIPEVEAAGDEAGKEPVDVRLPLGPVLAKMIRDDGRVSPILWSQDDPAFALAVAEGRAPGGLTRPGSRDIARAARGVGAQFILLIDGASEGGAKGMRATLLQGGRRDPVWASAESSTTSDLEVRVGGRMDLEAMAESVARTWALALSVGPFKDYVRPEAGGADPMAAPILLDPLFILDTEPDQPESAPMRALEMAREGQAARAILLLQDAIDRDPSALEPRAALCRLHMEHGRPELAAVEARQAAQISRDAAGLWLVAGEASIWSADLAGARECLKEAQSRGVAGPDSARLAALLGLAADQPGEALVQSEDRPDLAERAMIRAAAQGRLGLPFSPPLPAEPFRPSPLLYHVFLAASRADFDRAAELIRSLPIEAAGGGDAEAAGRKAEGLLAQCEGWGGLLSSVDPGETRKASHGLLVLAQRLLQQSSAEVLAFVRGVNPDAGKESAISLGEALKLIRAADEQRRLEG
jgi:hypothetical protein